MAQDIIVLLSLRADRVEQTFTWANKRYTCSSCQEAVSQSFYQSPNLKPVAIRGTQELMCHPSSFNFSIKTDASFLSSNDIAGLGFILKDQ